MKKYIQHNFILFALLNLCIPLLSSENDWSLKKPITSHKNWFQSKIDAYSDKMITRYSYTHNSFEHIRDMAILSVLPTAISQGILAKQRENMKSFLIKNEEDAFEEVGKYWGFDQEKWSKIKTQIKKEKDLNLKEMQKDQIFDTFHDSSLSSELIAIIKSECDRYNININSLNLIAKKDINTNEKGATASTPVHSPFETNGYSSPTIKFDIDLINKHNKKTKKHIINHELRHIIAGHNIRDTFIVNEIIDSQSDLRTQSLQLNHEIHTLQDELDNIFLFNSETKNKIKQKINILLQERTKIRKKIRNLNENRANEFNNSTIGIALTAATEKTADTFAACCDPKVAKNAALATKYSGYTANHNDMLVVNTNWETSQSIEKSRKALQSLKKKIQQATNIS